MGIRIKSKSDKFTLRDLSEFLNHLDNIYKAEVFLIQKKKYKAPYFYKKKLKDSESIFVGEISKKSPFDITIVPTVTIDGMAMILLTILNTIISVKTMCRGRNNDASKNEKNERRRIIKTEFQARRIRYDEHVIDESVKMTYSKIEIDEVDVENKTFSDYFDEEPFNS